MLNFTRKCLHSESPEGVKYLKNVLWSVKRCLKEKLLVLEKVDGYFTSKNKRTNSGITDMFFHTCRMCWCHSGFNPEWYSALWLLSHQSRQNQSGRLASRPDWLFITTEMHKPARGNIQVMAGVCLSPASGGLTWSASQWGATKRLSSGTLAAHNFLQIELPEEREIPGFKVSRSDWKDRNGE